MLARRGRRDIGGLCGKCTCTAVGRLNVIDVADRLLRLLRSNLSRRHIFCSATVSFLETATCSLTQHLGCVDGMHGPCRAHPRIRWMSIRSTLTEPVANNAGGFAGRVVLAVPHQRGTCCCHVWGVQQRDATCSSWRYSDRPRYAVRT